MMNLKRFADFPILMGAILFSLPHVVFGQATDDDLQLNTITTAVPFLMISPDARHSSLGDAGVATTPDEASSFWNPAKWAQIDDESGLAISYTPWLRNLGINDMGIMYLAGHYSISERTTMAASLKYFSLGNITFTDDNGTILRDHKPNEFSIDVAAATMLSKKISGGIAGRFIYSNLTDGLGQSRQAATSGSVDVSAYYKEDNLELFGRDAELGVGINVSNIGAKMSYTTTTGDKDFIPTNLRIGQATKIHFDEYNSITWALDINKLLVPTPQFDQNGNRFTPDKAVASAIFESFGDAPGGFSEEIEEYSLSTGLEYWYEDLFAIRAGYFYEHPNKGDRQYFTAGFGLKLNVFGIDGSYLIANRNNPLANTFRFTLSFSFDAFSQQKEEPAGE